MSWKAEGVREKSILKRFRADESGATAIEYALVCGIMFIAVVSVAATGGALGTVYDEVSKLIAPLGGSDPPADPP